MNIRLSTLSAALALAFVTPAAMALGLGQMQVKSGLNQPLVAEIPIISASPGELNELDVRLAAPEAFAAVGLDRPSGLSANLQFSVGKNASGQPVVRITTASRFNDPVLSFLIEANWGKGAVTREYTALIDPPYIAPAVVRPMSAPAMVAEQMPATPSAPAPEPAAPMAEAPAVPSAPPAPVYEPAPVVAEPMPVPVVTQAPAPPPQPVAAAPAPKPSRPAPKPQVAASKPAPKHEAAPTPMPKPSGDYGPVADGKTLWSIANQVRPDTSVSVNQVMLALLRVNPDAFASSNINQLKRGAVLRIPSRDDIATLTPDDAAALVREQAAAWKSPRATVPQPAESVAQPTPTPKPARQVASAPAKPNARLEIVPPSGKPSTHGTQSGAAAGGGGSELRAELVQTTEDLAARTAEVAELKSRVSDLEKMQADRQHMIDLQSSQLKDLQTRLQQQQAAQVAATPAHAATPAAAAPEEVAEPTPLYLNPWVLGGGGLVLLGGLVFAMRRKPVLAATGNANARRISDDESLRASLAKTRAAVVKPMVAKTESVFVPAVPVAEAAVAVDSELDARIKAVQQNPQDIEAHLNLLRLHHARGNSIEYEAAAQAMRDHVSSTLDPRWREAVIMGASLMPGHALFNQAGWNAPRFNAAEPAASVVPEVASPPQLPVEPTTPAVSVFDAPEHDEPEALPEPALLAATLSPAPVEDLHMDTMHDFGHGGLDLIDAPGELADAIPGHSDIHRSESQVQEEDDASATRIELAKAYLDIGDLDGARSMLEEVLAEGGPAAQAEADRILREIG